MATLTPCTPRALRPRHYSPEARPCPAPWPEGPPRPAALPRRRTATATATAAAPGSPKPIRRGATPRCSRATMRTGTRTGGRCLRCSALRPGGCRLRIGRRGTVRMGSRRRHRFRRRRSCRCLWRSIVERWWGVRRRRRSARRALWDRPRPRLCRIRTSGETSSSPLGRRHSQDSCRLRI